MKINRTHKNIAKLMTAKRKEKGYTINKVSVESEVDAHLIKKIENADGYNIITLCKLLAYYEVELDDVQKIYK